MRPLIIFSAVCLCLLLSCTVEAGVSVKGKLTHIKDAKVAEPYTGVVTVINTSEEPAAVRVYQTDYLFFCDGRKLYGEPGEIPRSNVSWMTFSPKQFTVPPKGTSQVNYTISVPDNGTLVGTYWSMLMVEGISDDLSEVADPEKGKVKLGIKAVMRYAVQIITNIGDTGTRKLKFLDTKVLREEGKRVLQLDVENIGERWLRPLLWTELYDEKGSYVGRFEDRRLRIYPGTSVRFAVDLSQVPEGKYKALVVADSIGEDLFGVTYALELK